MLPTARCEILLPKRVVHNVAATFDNARVIFSLQDKWFEMGLDLRNLRTVEQIQVDAFAPVAFSGNPAAVIFEHRDEQWMQNVATENNLAETSFLQVIPDKPYTYFLRWYVDFSFEADL